MNRILKQSIPPLLFLLGTGLSGCQFRPVSAALADSQPPYSIRSVGKNWRLDTRIPVGPEDLRPGISVYTGPEYSPAENPPGEAQGGWTRQNSWYYPSGWTRDEEFWYGWMLLDLFSIDRQRHVSPLGLYPQRVETLFGAFQNDQFTAYYPPEVSGAIGDVLGGTQVDSVFGVFFRAWPRDTLVAAQVEPGSAAWVAGIRADDRLLEFDGRWAANSLVYLRDTAGHRPVQINFHHPGENASRLVVVTRSPRNMPSLYRDTLPGGVGYISIGQFVSTSGLATDSLFQSAASWLELHSKGRWILDLRGNGGGTIETARRIVSALVPGKSNLLRILERDYDGRTLEGFDLADTMRSDSSVPRMLSNRPLYLLQDQHSASSSEIVISALREILGSSIETFGDTTFGKGIGQIYVPTPLDGFMAITCLHLDPMRAPRYHGIGIAPDHYLVSGDSAIDRAWKKASANLAARTAGGLAKVAPNLAALEWNRQEMKRRVVDPLLPKTTRRPFLVR